MHLGILRGRERLELEVRADRLVAAHRVPPAPPLADPTAAVRDALEKPLGYPALRRALTPDDHVVVVVEESLPHFAELLAPILEHVAGAGVTPATVTVVRPYALGEPVWRGRLPGVWQG